MITYLSPYLSRLSRQFGILNISQICSPLRPVLGIALPSAIDNISIDNSRLNVISISNKLSDNDPQFLVLNIYNTHKQKVQGTIMRMTPQANYTDWATATCRRNLVPTFVDRGVTRGQRGGSPTVVNLSFLDRSRYFLSSSSSFTLTMAKWTQ
jgi:hypothetical protein